MYIYRYTHTHTQPREHHGNWTQSKQTSKHSNTTLHSIPYTTLYIKAWGVVDAKHQQKTRWEMQCTEEWNACLWYLSITPPRQILTKKTLLLLNYYIELYFVLSDSLINQNIQNWDKAGSKRGSSFTLMSDHGRQRLDSYVHLVINRSWCNREQFKATA